MRNELIAVVLLTVGSAALADGRASAKYDPEHALKNAVVDTNGVKWIDGRYLPLEGKAFDDVDEFYDRLPSCVTTNVNGGVRTMKHHTSGMMFRFTTDSKTIRFSWKPYSKSLSMYHMASTGMSGIDVYRFDSKRGKWLYYRTGAVHDAEKGGSLYVDWAPGEACLVNLPLYNGIKEFKIGIDVAARVDALPPRTSGIEKPVVFYGTSITHGGCCTRPGLAFVNWIGRDLDVPVVGLGFSGAGRMELEMSEHLANIDASCYVLDCLWNMMLTEKQRPNGSVEGNYEKFIRNLRKLKPGVPLVMAEQCDVYCKGPCDKDEYIRALYKKLIAEGWKELYYLPKEVMFSDDQEGTVDGCHPNDLGMLALKNAYGEAIRKALKMTCHKAASEPRSVVVSSGIPSDADVLFDGTSLEKWRNINGGPASWKIQADGTLLVNKEGNTPGAVLASIYTKDIHTNFQMHVEYLIPSDIDFADKWRGNSGVKIFGCYEVQIIDSFNNPMNPVQMCGAIYSNCPPLANASQKPGVWQSYDIVFHAPVVRNGVLASRARISVLQNGVLIQDNAMSPPYPDTPENRVKTSGRIELQSHNDHSKCISFRNVWIRRL